MKKICFMTISVFLFVLLTACATNKTYSSTAKKHIGNLVVSYDEFENNTTVNINNPNIVNLSNAHIYPYFMYSNNVISYRITFDLNMTGKFNKIIFITEKGKYKITFDSSNQNTRERIRNNPFSESTIGDYRISEEQFKLFGEIFNSNNIKVAFYTVDNTVSEQTPYGNRLKDSYNEFLKYYQENNLSAFTDASSTRGSDIKIVKE